MKIITLDYETFFSNDYTLSKLSTEAYVRDPRFEAHGCAIKFTPATPAVWFSRDELPAVFEEIDWADTAVIAHHAQFDGLILSHVYKRKPKFWLDTLSMARLLLGNHLSVGLESLAKQFDLQAKTVPYNSFKNKKWDEIDPPTRQQIGAGACHDVELTWQLFGKLQKDFPREEYDIVNTVVSMFTDPVLRADTAVLRELWKSEAVKKRDNLAELGVTEADLQSAERFAQLLRDRGIEPDTKDGKKGPIYCFAKTDQFMRDLQEHDDDEIRLLAETRIGVKSTLLQTRAETLGGMARRGPLSVYLRYAGAGTLRVSGGDGANWLNFKRRSAIRKSILAPEGYVLAPIDSSQIECRVLHYLAGGPDEPVIQKFRRGEDPYVDIATEFYKEPIYKPKQDDPRREEMEAKRGMGKQGRLMCLGPETLILTNDGIKPITAVQLADRLWDGTEWVSHKGLVHQGDKKTVQALPGFWTTPDHRVLCGLRWCQASYLRDESIASLALAKGSANLPYPVMNWRHAVAYGRLSSAVRAGRPNIELTPTISFWDELRDATNVLKKHRVFGSKNIGATQRFAQTTTTAEDFLDAFQLFLLGAVQQPRITPAQITPGAASRSLPLGGKINARFWRIWFRCRDGMIRFYQLTESKITKAIIRGTYGLLIPKRKRRIAADCAIWKRLSPTYDLAYAGPRNRFTVVTDVGPVIVHNCGYGAGGPKFKATAKAGLYGPPVDISLEDSAEFVALYRRLNPSICARNTGYWAQAGCMLARLGGGPPIEWGPLTVKNKRLYLPEGQVLLYDTLEYYKPSPEEKHLYGEYARDGHWRVRTRQGWKEMWGSKLVQNVCEAVSRVIVSQAAIRIMRMGYRILNWPYDELLILIPKDGREEWHAERCKAEMLIAPAWLPGLPLDAEYVISERYSK